MQLTYTLTLADIKAALRLHTKQDRNRRIRFLISYAILPILAILGSIALILLLLSGHTEWASMFRIVDFVLILLSFFFYFYRVELANKSYKRIFPPTRTEQTSNIDIDDERIFSRTPGVSEEKYFWTAIVAFAQDEKMNLLYLDTNRFLLFPTRALSIDQRTELNDLVARNVVRKKS
jgi:hypothetical protein